jgi:hypothetical protein
MNSSRKLTVTLTVKSSDSKNGLAFRGQIEPEKLFRWFITMVVSAGGSVWIFGWQPTPLPQAKPPSIEQTR